MQKKRPNITNGTSYPIKRGQLTTKFHAGFQKFQKVSKVAILKFAKMAFFKFLSSAWTMQTSLLRPRLPRSFVAILTNYLRTIQCTYFVISVFFV